MPWKLVDVQASSTFDYRLNHGIHPLSAWNSMTFRGRPAGFPGPATLEPVFLPCVHSPGKGDETIGGMCRRAQVRLVSGFICPIKRNDHSPRTPRASSYHQFNFSSAGVSHPEPGEDD
jgi:hypothetical protein